MEKIYRAVVGFDKEDIANDGDEDVEKSVEDGVDFDFATATFGSGDDDKWCRKDNDKCNELYGREGVTKEKPAKYEVKHWGELSKDADIGGIVELEGSKIGDAGKRCTDAGESKHKYNDGVGSKRVKAGGNKDGAKDNDMHNAVE